MCAWLCIILVKCNEIVF